MHPWHILGGHLAPVKDFAASYHQSDCALDATLHSKLTVAANRVFFAQKSFHERFKLVRYSSRREEMAEEAVKGDARMLQAGPGQATVQVQHR